MKARVFNSLKLIEYELRILKRETILAIFVGLFLISLALIIGSKNVSAPAAWMVFENAAPLALMFMAIEVIAQDRNLRTVERMFSFSGSGYAIYLRRLFVTFTLDMIIVFALAVLWQTKEGTPSVSRILSVSISPALFLSTLGFFGALLLNDGNGGAVIGAGWWLINEFILRGYGNTSWFGYVFLFKETYYPNAPDLWINRLTLLLLTAVLVGINFLLLRKAERYL